MLEIIKDKDENIQAVFHWLKVNEDGTLNKFGHYIYVGHLEISKSARNNGIIRKIIGQVLKKAPFMEFGYFKRSKYQKRMRIYPRHRWQKLLKGERKDDVIIN